MMNQAKGKNLTQLAKIYGLKRRWFGLEPDFMLRRRILSKVTGRPYK